MKQKRPLNRLREFRLKLGYTTKAMSEALGYNWSTYRKLEAGLSPAQSHLVFRISTAFGFTLKQSADLCEMTAEQLKRSVFK